MDEGKGMIVILKNYRGVFGTGHTATEREKEKRKKKFKING